jgi:hypothetical protein
MRIRSAVCSLVLIVGLAGGVFTATGASAAKKLDPCPGAAVPAALSGATAAELAVWGPIDDVGNGGNGDGWVCNGAHKVTDDRCTYDGTVCII